MTHKITPEENLLPSAAAERKRIPVASGVLDYFPAALIEIAKVSFAGNEQHNPGQPLHWARGKSTDQDDTIIRHFMERGKVDTDGMRHSAKLAWRALALLQLELEAAGAPIARGAWESGPEPAAEIFDLRKPIYDPAGDVIGYHKLVENKEKK